MKRYVLSEEELYWDGFLIDLDVQDACRLFKKKASITRFKSDHETVHEAWDTSRTIVTRNEADYVPLILDHSKRDSGPVCQDCWGLLIVPDLGLVRERVIPKVKHTVVVNGTELPWHAVGFANLCVYLHDDGRISVKRFRRCVHCEKHSPIREPWYMTLSVIGRR